MRLILPLVLLLVVADVVARQIAENAIADQLAARSSQPGGSSEAHIRSFPFIGRLLLGGEVARVDFRLELAADAQGPLSVLDGRLDGVRVNRSLLIGEQRVRVTDLRHGTAGLDLSERLLSAKARLPLEVEADGITVVIRGVRLPVRGTVTAAGRLRLEIPGVRGVEVADTRLDRYRSVVGCTPVVTTRHDFVRVACGFDTVPPALREAA